jgi:hypothetical protein
MQLLEIPLALYDIVHFSDFVNTALTVTFGVIDRA